MTATTDPPNGPEPVRSAGLFGALAGALSVVDPYFDGLTVALAALLLLGWLLRRPSRKPIAGEGIPGWLAGTALAIGWFVYLASPPELAVFRGLALGLAGLPLVVGLRGPWERPKGRR